MKKYIIFTMILAIVASLLLVSCGNTDNQKGDESTNDKTEALEFSETPSEGLESYPIDDKTCMITGIGSCTDTMVRIPSEIGALKVTTVCTGSSWKRKEPIKGIMIPDSVTKISTNYDETFGFSRSLEKFILPDTPISFGNVEIIFGTSKLWGNPNDWEGGALYIGNHLIRVNSEVNDTFVIRNGTVNIARAAFYSSAVTHVIIPNSVIAIDQEAFLNCEVLNRITIGVGVKYIGENAFYNCDVLRKIAYAGSETEWQSIEKNGMRGGTTPTNYEVIYNWSDTDTETNTVTGTTDPKYFTFMLNEDGVSYKAKVNRDYIGTVTEYHIPAEYEGLPVTQVGSFGGLKNVTVITMPDSVTSVDSFAWGNNEDLTAIRLSSKLQVLPENLCMGCGKLNNVVIPASVTQIDTGAFGGCTALSNIKYDGTVEQWNAVTKGEWWLSGTADSNPAQSVICADGVATLSFKKITSGEWNDMLSYGNFMNVTIKHSSEFFEGGNADNPKPEGTIKIDGLKMDIFGAPVTDSEELIGYKNLYFNTITGMAKDFDNFEYDSVTDTYVSKEAVTYTVSISYADINLEEKADITATNVKIKLDDANRLSTISVDMRQEITNSWEPSETTVLVLKTVLTLSDYGTTVIQW